MTKLIYLLRHASTGEERLIFKGVTDAPLSVAGVAEARAMGESFARRGVSFDAVYSSPLSRAVDTAVLAGRRGAEEISVSGDLADIDCGEWEGRSVEEISFRHPDLFRRWRETPSAFEFPGGESVASAAGRAAAFLRELTFNEKASSILVVTHRIIINLMVLAALEIEVDKYWRFRYDNCRYTVIGHDGGYFLKAMNLD